MRVRATIAGTVIATSALVGCSSSPDTAPTDTPQPTSAQSSASAATAPALPEVTFNPCDDIGDALLLRFGLDPANRDRNEFALGRETILACNVVGDHRAVGFVAQNTAWEDIPFDVTPQPASVNGREAWYVPGGLSDDSCTVLMRTNFGAVIVDSAPGLSRHPDPSLDRCDSIMEIAEAVEPLIDN
ncbi:DUF3558 family protein [Millisia brevis]|uniref:DUF3558 family protein n=1 Tax=Millisia brevis TaxID=264148 RepID=UPI001471A938|nr:DUF3558 family protein [Millisia brevis]